MTLKKARHALKIIQKSKKMYVTTFSASELEAICEAPKLTEKDIKKPSKYQRELGKQKVSKIEKWWDDGGTFLPNSVIIQFKDKEYLDVNFPDDAQSGTVKITDDSGKKIANLLDGQHRVVGCSRSLTKKDEPLLTTIVSSDFNKQQVGKMFIEMNNEATKLGPIHIMHLQARYGMKPFVGEGKYAYDLMYRLWEDGGTNPLFSRGKGTNSIIRILDKKHGRISAVTLAKELTKIYSNHGTSMQKNTNKDFVQFSHFLDVLTDYWSDDWANLQSAMNNTDLFSQMIVPLYPTLIERARNFVPAGAANPLWPGKKEWEAAIKCKVKYIDKANNVKTCDFKDYISWSSDIFNQFKTDRTHPQITKLLSEKISSSAGKNELDFTDLKTASHGYDNFGDYLRRYEPDDFDLYVIDDAGAKPAPTALPSSAGAKSLYLKWNKSSLTKDKAFIKIEHNGDIVRQGEFTSNTSHDMFHGQIIRGWKGFKTGETYEISVTQSCANANRYTKNLTIIFV
jgi:DGQHR domain-containing protein